MSPLRNPYTDAEAIAAAMSHYNLKTFVEDIPILFLVKDSLALYAPLFDSGLSGATFNSLESYGHSCVVTDAIWSSLGRTFDGNAQISIPDAILPEAGTAWSIEAWVKITSDRVHMVVAKASGTVTATQEYLLYFNASANNYTAVFYISDHVYAASIASTTSNALNTWYHIVGTYDGANLRIYRNGVADATPVAVILTVFDSANNVLIGTRPTMPAHNLIGSVGEVRFYNKGLSAEEVLNNYRVTSSRYE